MAENEFYGLVQDYKNWLAYDGEQKHEFIQRKLTGLCSPTAGHDCTTSGTTGSAKRYKWGPDFFVHMQFYNWLFYDGHVNTNLFCYWSLKEQRTLVYQANDFINVFVGETHPHFEKIQNARLTCNAEVIYLIESKRPFLQALFDLETCVFCFTGSPYLPCHKELFESLGMKCRNHMRCWDGGATFFTCAFGSNHWVDFSSVNKVEDGNLISTDLWNRAQPHIDYRNGDILEWKRGGLCECGMDIDHIDFGEKPIAFEWNGAITRYATVLKAMNANSFSKCLTLSVCPDELVIISDFAWKPGKTMTDLASSLKTVGIEGNVRILNSHEIISNERKRIRVTVKDKPLEIGDRVFP